MDSYRIVNWFNVVINSFIKAFFIFAIISTICVFSSFINGIVKYIFLLVLFLAYIFIIYKLKDRANLCISSLINKLNVIDLRRMLLIITSLFIILKIIYTVFFNFDPTSDGDIGLYNEIANSILKGNIDSNTISHLIGIGYHLAFIKFFDIPLHVGISIFFILGIIFSFLTFCSIVGKEKSFIIVVLYIMMPSTMLLTFCPTHEIFVFFYLSIIVYVVNKFISNNQLLKNIVFSLILTFALVLINFVSPMGKVVYIIFGICVLMSNLEWIKKSLLIIILIMSIVSTNLLTKQIELNPLTTKWNTYNILLYGSSVECNGEHTDGYPNIVVKKYLKEHNLPKTDSNRTLALKETLIEQYKYLFTHPFEFIKLLSHKFYKYWSGNHYSIEMANSFGSVDGIMYYLMLCFSTIIYLFILTVGFVYSKKKNDCLIVSFIKLLLLGVMSVLLISLVLNKYSVYMTLFIYFLAIYQAEFIQTKANN